MDPPELTIPEVQVDADNPQPPDTNDASNLSHEVSDAEVDQTLRMLGGDPESIGRRGLEAALAELKKLREKE